MKGFVKNRLIGLDEESETNLRFIVFKNGKSAAKNCRELLKTALEAEYHKLAETDKKYQEFLASQEDSERMPPK